MGIGPSKEEQEILKIISNEVIKIQKDIKLNGTLEDKPPAEVKVEGSVNGKKEEESMEELLKDFNELIDNNRQLEKIKPIIEKTFLELNNHSDILAKYYQDIKIDDNAMEPTTTGRRKFTLKRQPTSQPKQKPSLVRQKRINLEPVLKQLKQLKQLVEQICDDKDKNRRNKKVICYFTTDNIYKKVTKYIM